MTIRWLFVAVQVVAAVSSTFAATIRVPADAPTIQIAIKIAQPFDTIIVAPGTYFEAISYGGKVIAIQSEDPNDPDVVAATVINAGGLGTVVTFAGSEGAEHATLNGFTITGGTTGIYGGMSATRATIQNCVVRDNSAVGIDRVGGDILGCEVRDNEGTGIRDCFGTISHCRIVNNLEGLFLCQGVVIDCQVLGSRSISNAVSNGSGFRTCSSLVQRCVVSNNGKWGFFDGNTSIKQCIVSGNGRDGLNDIRGAIVENSVIAGNKEDGFEACRVDVLNCAVTGNQRFGFAGHTESTIRQCIIWDNQSGGLSGSITPILSGTVNPFFIQPGHWDPISDVWIEGDYHVAPDSPYIDAGSPLFGDDPSDPTEDLDGNPRIVGARVDIGPYEFQAPCQGDDFDGDGKADICDNDIDGDGVGNTLDPCDFTPPGIPVDSTGRPRADLNLDCAVDLRDYATFQLSITGP